MYEKQAVGSFGAILEALLAQKRNLKLRDE